MKAAGSNEATSRVVVLLSGGMDSCVTAALAAQTYEVYALHASYGQRTQERERKAFREVANSIGAAKTMEVDLGVLAQIGTSSLVDSSQPVPVAEPLRGEIPSTYVPFRNGVLLAVAAAWAESVGANKIFIGAVAPDTPQGYPDTTRVFFDAFERAIALGTKPETEISIEAPLVNMSKTEAVKKGMEIGAPLELTWSCYRDGDSACGVCLSCKSRIKAFSEAGVRDPVEYKIEKEERTA